MVTSTSAGPHMEYRVSGTGKEFSNMSIVDIITPDMLHLIDSHW